MSATVSHVPDAGRATVRTLIRWAIPDTIDWLIYFAGDGGGFAASSSRRDARIAATINANVAARRSDD